MQDVIDGQGKLVRDNVVGDEFSGSAAMALQMALVAVPDLRVVAHGVEGGL